MSTITEHPRTIDLSQIETEVSDSQNNSCATEEKVRRADSPLENGLPFQQNIALLHAARERLVYTQDYPVPLPKTDDELVVEIRAIGLNPVDWKSIDYNFAIPQLPYIAGRDFAGVVVRAPTTPSRLRVGDLVLSPSTDYRDIRKSAFQEYAISTQHNVAKLPQNVPTTHGASIGVAYVAAALALGVSLGLNLPKVSGQDQADLWEAVRKLPQDAIPIDVAAECLSSIENSERPQQGDWIAIYGGSSTSALFISEIARLAGLKVILLADFAKHGERLGEREGSILVDSHDPIRAINVVRAITKGKLRFAVDTVGKETAGHLVQMLQADAQEERRAHLVGLTGVPKEKVDGIVFHSVPIKLFHEVPSIGLTLMTWLEKALETQAIALPEVEHAGGGLEGINAALDRMRNGEISGRRLVISV
ncbi:GroES-like protein [Aureobasidium pullulans EXF-150]|uniref:GroES-like protein n=1 Tax=Aureobasidium pullulans EXF-150 TaxID=1043002 RepID=A0A074Y7H1_AURPU|nr:GroES-like protein [Aureobasidium pullulans EXF-150]KEQ82841.1 GroES-like protein [Aureobasidium pullulans EXF-150]